MATITGGQRWVRIDSTAETTPGVVNTTPTWDGIRATSAGLGLLPNKQTIEALEEASVTSQPAPIFTHCAPGGTLGFIPSCHDSTTVFGSGSDGWLRFFLDWLHKRTSGALNSHTLEVTDESIITRQFVGCKPNSFSASWTAEGGILETSAEILALHVGRRSSALGTASAASVTFPSSRNWIVTNVAAQIGAELTASNDNVTSEGTLTAFSFNITNNITAGPPLRWVPGASASAAETFRYGINDLREGDLAVTGSMTILLENDDWFDRMLEDSSSDNRGSARILGFHPDSTRTQVDMTAGVATNPTGGPISITVDDESGFATGDVVYLEDNSNSNPENWKREVLELSSTTSNTIHVVTDGDADDNDESYGRNQTFTDNSYAWSKGLSLRFPKLQILDVQPTGGARDKVGRTITFRAETGDAESTYSPSPGTNWDAYPMKWLVK